jgi:hypothetical protein
MVLLSISIQKNWFIQRFITSLPWNSMYEANG